MTRRYLMVDGMLSGTGIRDKVAGGYVDLNELGLSADLTKRLANWLLAYENAHYHSFANRAEVERLDQEGIEITKRVRDELPDAQVDYFSDATMQQIPIA
jgi:hypothetical protein